MVLGCWFALERRIAHPLVPTEMLTHRPVLFTHLAGLLVGAGMFVNITTLTYFVQTSRENTGYGFGANPMESGLVTSSRARRWASSRRSARAPSSLSSARAP